MGEGIKLKPIPQKEKEDTSHGSNVDKVSKDLARTSNDAKENINNDKYIETKENEKAPSLKQSISREDDKMKIKKTSIDKRIDFINTEKMKNECILAVSELNKIEGNMEDKSIQQLHHNLNDQKVGPVQTNVKRENADSRLKESTG